MSGITGGSSDDGKAGVCPVCCTSPCLTYVQRKALAEAAAIVEALFE